MPTDRQRALKAAETIIPYRSQASEEFNIPMRDSIADAMLEFAANQINGARSELSSATYSQRSIQTLLMRQRERLRAQISGPRQCSGEPLPNGEPRCGHIDCSCHGGD